MAHKLTFANPKNDIAFRKIFGDQNHCDILMEFLNEVLDLETPIVEVTIMNPYQMPLTKGLKLTTLDVRARDKRHEFLIEMQVEKEQWLAQRVMYYVSKAYVTQLKKKENYVNLKPVVFLGILNFREFSGKQVFNRHRCINTRTGNDDLKQIELNFIELPNFTKNESELTSLTDQWLYFFKHAESLDQIPESVTSEHLRGAYHALNEHNWSPEELDAYEHASLKEQARENSVTSARLLAKKEVALELVTMGLSSDKISKATGLPATEIMKLVDVR